MPPSSADTLQNNPLNDPNSKIQSPKREPDLIPRIMAIFMDRPRSDGWAHLFSDKAGEAGSRELEEFADRIGLIRRRIHALHTYAEHYDIRGGEIHLVRAAGVPVVDRRELGRILKKKRSVMGPRRGRLGRPRKIPHRPE